MSPGIPAALSFLLVIAILTAGCVGSQDSSSPAAPPPGQQPAPAGIALPENRPFFMGFTPMPYDATGQAVRDTYNFTGEHGDIILHHFDQGVPWPEALGNSSYSRKFQSETDLLTGQRREGQKVYLAVTPLSSGRNGLALWYGEQENMPLPVNWNGRHLDDPQVVKAYTNHCRSMIRQFHPDYFAYGIEVNMLAREDPEEFVRFTSLARQVYTTIKQENPGLPVFLTFQADTYAADEKSQREAITALLPYTDYMAVSTYPYLDHENPDDLPPGLFSQMHALAPEKPFAIAETGFPADNVNIEKYHLSRKGSPEWQSRYVTFLLTNADRLDARFVIWFVPEDYDPLWNRLRDAGADELLKLWMNCGLADSSRNPRPSLAVWDAWYRLPRR